MCVCKTEQNTINTAIGVAAVEVLPFNPRRKAFMLSPTPAAAGAAHAISLSLRPDVTVGVGSLNFLLGQYGQTIITDEDIGSAIQLPWFAVCGDAGTAIQITEFNYEQPPSYASS